MKEKVVITDCSSEVNTLLNSGWLVKMVVPQYVSSGNNTNLKGMFCFVLYKNYNDE
jgi:hypothetical protein